ncbi:MAG: acylneuraminate cytidylyltransferase family protein [Desulfobacula sp.]|jgi:CMP-N-acetylneuraminic acid synthetase|nr:acylneuraminate cytidylyltransferase family protein [Desulfobacula sp.]
MEIDDPVMVQSEKNRLKPVGRDVLAIIPARGGSKGIPRKNIQDIAGKPLIAYSIEVALNVPNIDRVFVSTDDEEIAEVAMGFGAEVPVLRPTDLASDTSEIQDALLFIRNYLYSEEGYAPLAQVVMYPTHPFRKLSTVSNLVHLLCNGYANVNTFTKIMPEERGYWYESQGRMALLLDHGNTTLNKVYHRGSGYFSGWNLFPEATKLYAHILTDEIESLDIDDWDDLLLADYIIKNNLFDFEL